MTTLTITPHNVLPNVTTKYEQRDFEFEDIAASVKRHSDWENGIEIGYSERLVFSIINDKGRFQVEAWIGKNGNLTSASCVKKNPNRDRYMPDGTFQELAQRICDFYRSTAGQAAWRERAKTDYESEIAELRSRIDMLNKEISEIDKLG